MKELNIYSGVFLEDGTHVTIEFNPGKCTIPERLEEGEMVDIIKIGEYKDDEVECDIVTIHRKFTGVPLLKQQADGTPLHITRRATGVAPVESGRRAKKYGYAYTFASHPLTIWEGRVGYFKAAKG